MAWNATPLDVRALMSLIHCRFDDTNTTNFGFVHCKEMFSYPHKEIDYNLPSGKSHVIRGQMIAPLQKIILTAPIEDE